MALPPLFLSQFVGMQPNLLECSKEKTAGPGGTAVFFTVFHAAAPYPRGAFDSRSAFKRLPDEESDRNHHEQDVHNLVS